MKSSIKNWIKANIFRKILVTTIFLLAVFFLIGICIGAVGLVFKIVGILLLGAGILFGAMGVIYVIRGIWLND